MNPIRDPLIVNLAPTGMVPTREQSGKVPLQPDEIIADVLRAAAQGITIVHLHARDAAGKPTYKKEVYARIISGIREKRPDLVLCVSCSGRMVDEIDRRTQVLELKGDLKPDMATLTLSSMNFSDRPSINSPSMIKELAKRMTDCGVAPELEIFDLGMANYTRHLIERGILKTPLYANLICGNIAGAQPHLLEIASLINALPKGVIWGLGGLGRAQVPMAGLAAGFAPGVRIGLEDNLWSDFERTALASNIELVEFIKQFLMPYGRSIMPPEMFRRLIRFPG